MNKSIKSALILLLCCVLGFVVYQSVQIIKQKEAFAEQKQRLPSLKYCLQTDSTQFVEPVNNSVIIVYFSPDCDHCQRQAQGFYKQKSAFVHTQILMVSTQPLATIRQFGHDYKLDKLLNFRLLQLPKEHLYTTFGSVSVPHIFVYSAQHQLTKEFKGETPIDSLVGALAIN
jgi:peroxiredoxin